MSDAAPALMLLAWPKECPRCRVRHLIIPMTLDDYAIVEAERLARVIEQRIFDDILSARR